MSWQWRHELPAAVCAAGALCAVLALVKGEPLWAALGVSWFALGLTELRRLDAVERCRMERLLQQAFAKSFREDIARVDDVFLENVELRAAWRSAFDLVAAGLDGWFAAPPAPEACSRLELRTLVGVCWQLHEDSPSPERRAYLCELAGEYFRHYTTRCGCADHDEWEYDAACPDPREVV